MGQDGTAADGRHADNDPAAILARYKQALTFGEKANELVFVIRRQRRVTRWR